MNILLMILITFRCSNTKEDFLKTATILINRLFHEEDSSEVKIRESNNQIELANDNQKDNSLFEKFQAHIKHFTDSVVIQPNTLFIDRSQL